MRLGHTWGSFWGMVRFDVTGRAPRSPVMMRDRTPGRSRQPAQAGQYPACRLPAHARTGPAAPSVPPARNRPPARPA